MERLEVKFTGSADDAGTFTAYAATFNGVDRVGDTIERGAFARTLKDWQTRGAKIPLLWAHDAKEPIGVVESIEEDANGLAVKGRLVLETARAREVHALMLAGAISTLSIGFKTKSSVPGPNSTRVLKDVDLFEISPVAVPADPRAAIRAVKAADAADPENPADRAAEGDSIMEVDELKAALAATDERVKTLETETKAHKDRADALELALKRPDATDDKTVKPEAKAFLAYARLGDQAMGADERKDLVASNDPAGGYLAHPELVMEIEKNLTQTSPVRAAARVSSTGKGSVILPKRTGNLTAYWVGETETRTETQPAYGQNELPVHELACYVDVSNQLLEDADFNLEAELASDFAEEFGLKEGTAFVGGNGIKKPLGFLNAGVTEVANGHATTLSADALVSLAYNLPQFYRANATWGMNSATLAVVRKLKDGQNNYLWQPSYQAGQPETLLGRPVVEMPDMPDIAADATPIVIGNFQKFRIFDRIGLSVLRDPFTQATNGLVRFHARRRVAAGVTQAEAFRLLSMEV